MIYKKEFSSKGVLSSFFDGLSMKITLGRTWNHEYSDRLYIVGKVMQLPFQRSLPFLDQWSRTNVADLKATLPPNIDWREMRQQAITGPLPPYHKVLLSFFPDRLSAWQQADSHSWIAQEQ